jgi:glycosyl transferase family 87
MTRSVGTDRRLTLKYWMLLILMIGFFVVVGAESAMRFLEEPTSGDFKHFYYAAYGVVHDQNIYASGEPFTGVHWYAYFPLFAVVLSPLVWMGLGGAGAAWSVINAGLIVLCVYIAVRESVTRLGMKANPNILVGVSFLVVLVFMDKLRSELRMGQSDAFVMVWMMLGLMWIGKRPILAGFMMGGSVNVKLQGLVFLPYLIVRGRVKNLIGFVGGTVFFAMFGVLIWGFDRNMEYLGTVLGWVGGLVGVEQTNATIESGLYPLEWERSVTIPSVLKRAQLHWGLTESVVKLGTLAMIGLIVAAGWAMYKKRNIPLLKGRLGKSDDANAQGRGLVGFEWAGLIVGMLIFSPQSTVRHFFLAIIVVALAAAVLHTSIHWKRKIGVGVMLALFWASITFPPGGERYEALTMQWRAIGGSMWMLLGLYFVTLWTGLGIVRELPDSGQNTVD